HLWPQDGPASPGEPTLERFLAKQTPKLLGQRAARQPDTIAQVRRGGGHNRQGSSLQRMQPLRDRKARPRHHDLPETHWPADDVVAVLVKPEQTPDLLPPAAPGCV